MNERIRELEKQATNVVEGWSDENGTTRYYEFNKEKFAELVAAECAVALATVPGGVDSSIWYTNLQKFNKHLGIKS